MTHWIKACRFSELSVTEGKLIRPQEPEYAELQIALFRLANGDVHAMDNRCPHRGASLVEGDMDGSIVICPWHSWEFDVTTGGSPVNPAACVRKFPCRIDGDDVMIEVS